MSAREVVREVEVDARAFVEMEQDHIRSLILGSLQVDPGALPEPQPLTTADVKSAVAVMRMAEKLRRLANERLRERVEAEIMGELGRTGAP